MRIWILAAMLMGVSVQAAILDDTCDTPSCEKLVRQICMPLTANSGLSPLIVTALKTPTADSCGLVVSEYAGQTFSQVQSLAKQPVLINPRTGLVIAGAPADLYRPTGRFDTYEQTELRKNLESGALQFCRAMMAPGDRDVPVVIQCSSGLFMSAMGQLVPATCEAERAEGIHWYLQKWKFGSLFMSGTRLNATCP